MEKKQESFTALDLDTNPSLVSSQKGFMLDNRNGRINKGNGRDYVWENDNGDKKVFNIPPTEAIAEEELPGVLNLYCFDGRREGFGTTQDGTRNFTIYFYKANEAMSATALVGKLQCQLIWDIPSQNLTINMKATGFPSQSSTPFVLAAVTFDTSITGKTIERHFHETLAQNWGSFPGWTNTNRAGFTIEVFKHGVIKGQPNFIPELEVNDDRYADYGWHNKVTYDTSDPVYKNPYFVVLAEPYTVGTPESDGYRFHNHLGWGNGAINPGVSFPSQGPFPTPGDDFAINPLALERPQGLNQVLADNDFISAFSGGILKGVIPLQDHPFDDETDPNSNRPDYLKSLLLTLPVQVEETKDYWSATAQAKIITSSPISFAYPIMKQRYTLISKRRIEFPEITGTIPVDESRVVLICSVGKDTPELTIGYLAEFGEIGVGLTKLFETTENLDISLNQRVKRGICRVESADNIKCYWTTGKGHVRTLDVINPPTSDFDFNTRLFKPVTFGKIQVSNSIRHSGALLVGSYQFCYDLSVDGFNWTRKSLHTNPISIGQTPGTIEHVNEDSVTTFPTSPPNNDPTYRGYPAGTKTSESIEISVSNIDRRYRFIRVWAIEMISGSGDGSVVVNVVANKELENKDYLAFVTTHSGINSVVQSGFNISDVSLPTIVPYNVNDIEINENRLVFAGYDEYVRELTDSEKADLTFFTEAGLTHCVGSNFDTNDQPGFKNWYNQQWNKSQQHDTEYEMAWCFSDDYGNITEPCCQFAINSGTENKWFHFIAQYNNFTSDISRIQDDLFSPIRLLNPLISAPSSHDFNGAGYVGHSIGFKMGLIPGFKFPSWAKKAHIVRRIKDSYDDQVFWGWGAVYNTSNNLITLGFVPDSHGYNATNRFSINAGDEFCLYMVSSNAAMNMTDNTNPPPAENIRSIPVMLTVVPGTTDRVYIGVFSKYIRNETFVINDIKIEKAGDVPYVLLELDRDIPLDLSGDPYNSGVLFYVKRKPHATDSSVVKYENTGFEFDLRFNITPKKYRVFGGDCYISSPMKIVGVALTSAVADHNVDLWNPDSSNKLYNYWIPCLSRYNYTMGTIGWEHIPYHQADADYNLISYNRDFAPTNSKVPIIFISEAFLKEKTTFKNSIRYTDVKEANSKFDAFTSIKANNFVDLVSPFGEITNVRAIASVLVIIFESGVAILYPNDKELVQTTSGTRVSVGDGSYLLNREDDISSTFGTKGRALKTDMGVYFIDERLNIIALITRDLKFIDLSKMARSRSFTAIQENKPSTAYNQSQYTIGYDKKRKEVYFTVTSKLEVFADVLIQTESLLFNIWIDAFDIGQLDSKIIIEDDWVLISVDINETNYFSDPSVEMPKGNYYMVSVFYTSPNVVLKSASSPAHFAKTSRKVTKAYFDTDTLVFDEDSQAFTYKTDLTFMESFQANDSMGTISPFTKNSVLKPAVTGRYNEDINPDFVSSLSFETFNIRTHWFANRPSGTLINTIDTAYLDAIPESELPRRVKVNINISSNFNANFPFAGTSKRFVFQKGYTYRFEFDVVHSGSFSGVMNMIMNPIGFFLLENAFEIVDSQSFTNIGGAQSCFIEFTALRSFESPMVFLNGSSIASMVGYFQISIVSIQCWCAYDSGLSVPLNHEGEETKRLFTYDNGVIQVKDGTPIPDVIEITTPEQNAVFSVDVSTKAKKKLRKIEFSVPMTQVNGLRERPRGSFISLRILFKNNIAKFVIESITHIFRDSL